MKKRILLSVLSVILVLALTACGSSVAGGTYTGTVSAISADSITITTDDGQSLVIPITSETVFTRGGGHGGGPGGTGDAPADGQAPSGDAPADGQAPSGDAPADGRAPSDDAPADGQAPSGDDTADRPAPSDGGNGPMTSGDMPAATSGVSMAALTYADIAVGDSVTVVVTDKGKAESITLGFGGGMNDGPAPAASDSGAES